MAFIGLCGVNVCGPSRITMRSVSTQPTLSTSRRKVLQGLAWVLFPVGPALADRTGKYSTKLTAKRRYVPRIARGAEVRKHVSHAMVF
mmetsp:Transcript_9040/g.18272  ORF Transcript_9040/g.18272 Transcript_9040/m.18272 type:complete len:88 (+) Transcript_9040:124-387(+)